MVCWRQSNSFQQWAGCWTGCRTRRRTGYRAWLRGNKFGLDVSFGLGVLHGNGLRYFWSTLLCITVHQAKGWGWPSVGSSFTSASVCPALTRGLYSYNMVLSDGKHIIIYLITENSGVGTGVEMARWITQRPVLFSSTDAELRGKRTLTRLQATWFLSTWGYEANM